MPELDAGLVRRLSQGCEALGLPITAEQQHALECYVGLLHKWNKAYNLTAIRQMDQMVVRHLLDSLAISPYMRAERVIDVGSGAGLPGVPLAIVFPRKQFHLLDSNGKKTRFLFQVKTALGLDNMTIHQARVESLQTAPLFDAVVSRAFASLQDMVVGCHHLLSKGGCFMAMKGVYPTQELAALRLQGAQVTVHVLEVPGLDEARHLVEIQPQVVKP